VQEESLSNKEISRVDTKDSTTISAPYRVEGIIRQS
jgi:hypothetical protein